MPAPGVEGAQALILRGAAAPPQHPVPHSHPQISRAGGGASVRLRPCWDLAAGQVLLVLLDQYSLLLLPSCDPPQARKGRTWTSSPRKPVAAPASRPGGGGPARGNVGVLWPSLRVLGPNAAPGRECLSAFPWPFEFSEVLQRGFTLPSRARPTHGETGPGPGWALWRLGTE